MKKLTKFVWIVMEPLSALVDIGLRTFLWMLMTSVFLFVFQYPGTMVREWILDLRGIPYGLPIVIAVFAYAVAKAVWFSDDTKKDIDEYRRFFSGIVFFVALMTIFYEIMITFVDLVPLRDTGLYIWVAVQALLSPGCIKLYRERKRHR